MAYNVDGNVYFDTSAFPQYGKLSRQSLDDLESGARIDVDVHKKNPMDFVLWKRQKPGEPAWESPWGKGRPGWHIECSVMSMKYLGETIDIHSGGQDLIFPHHENEIAQSEGATGKPFARYWIHNGYINIDNKKMSKSLGNFFTVRELSKEFNLEVVRLFMLSAHYRNPINFSEELLKQAESALERLYNAKGNLEYLVSITEAREMTQEEQDLKERIGEYRLQFEHAMEDDINTADALAAIFDMVRDMNRVLDDESSRQIVEVSYDELMKLTGIMGLLQKEAQRQGTEEIETLIQKRQKAREEKNWVLADSIRDKLNDMGIV